METLFSVLVSIVAVSSASAASGTRPNIVLVITDDRGFSDVGCYGGEIETPNIDSLAHDGLKFSQFYNCGKCDKHGEL